MTSMDAMILAAGLGERMLPLTDTTPKPLLRVGGRSLVEHHLSMLADIGLNKVIINISHLHEKIISYFENNNHHNLEIDFSVEPGGPFGTAEGVRRAAGRFSSETLFVINADVFTDYRPKQLQLSDSHAAHLTLVPNPPHRPQGDFSFENGMLGPLGTAENGLTFAGIGIYRTALFRDTDYTSPDLGDLVRSLASEGKASAEVHEGLWIDVGTVERLEQARVLAASPTSG